MTDATAKLEAPKTSLAPKKAAATPELLVLLLAYGMSGAELAATLDRLKNESKSIGSHKRRQLFWEAYSKMIAKLLPLTALRIAF